jgi:Protein of unknown function (DUF3048) N-terminal domain/Protein of unknown function (DUF3048) C-terminal domain
MKKFVRSATVVVAISLLVTSCSKGNETADVSPTPTVSEAPVTLWPFTQLPGPADAAEKPVLAIKIENDPSVRPQYGLDMADLVFEELVEGGMTRFISVFQSEIPEEAGPVRSGRHVDASIISTFADYFVFSGAARATLKYFSNTIPDSVVISTEGAPGMHRTKYHPMPHNLFMYPQELIDSNKATVSKTDGFFVKPATVSEPAGIAISKVALKFSTATKPNWTWDEATKLWLRDDGKKPHMAISGNQLSATSLVVLKVTETDAGYKGSTGGYVPRTVVTGTGKGYLIIGDTMTEVTWSKPDDVTQMTLTDPSGNVVHPAPGKTWVELITTSGDATFTPAAAPSASPSKS